MTPPELDVREELTRAAADLEALTARFDETTADVERLEAVLDAVLDDPGLQVCVVGEDLRITAVSRGLADRWGGAQPPLGRRADELAPESWGDLTNLVASLTDDQWTDHQVDGGVLWARRTSAPDDGSAQIVLRFVAAGEAGEGVEA